MLTPETPIAADVVRSGAQRKHNHPETLRAIRHEPDTTAPLSIHTMLRVS
jgi:hypothetical protein